MASSHRYGSRKKLINRSIPCSGPRQWPDLCIVDTAPHSETNALDAANAADLILIPCRPSSFDLKAITTSIKLTKIAQKPAVIVINGAQPRGSLANQAEQGITEKYSMQVLETRVTQRAAFVHSATEGKTVFEYEPGGAAAAEIEALFSCACLHVGMHSHKREIWQPKVTHGYDAIL